MANRNGILLFLLRQKKCLFSILNLMKTEMQAFNSPPHPSTNTNKHTQAHWCTARNLYSDPEFVLFPSRVLFCHKQDLNTGIKTDHLLIPSETMTKRASQVNPFKWRMKSNYSEKMQRAHHPFPALQSPIFGGLAYDRFRARVHTPA